MKIALALADPSLSEFFTIVRTSGDWGEGGWEVTEKIEIKASGTVGMASPKEVQATPEADHISGARIFTASQELYVTRDGSEGGRGTSDVIKYDGEEWKIYLVWPYRNRGYWKALAARTLGE